MSKPIIITDDTVVNSYGFRVLTDGIDLSLYSKNPIMLYDHARREDDDTDVILPIGTMADLARQGSQLIATPVFDADDEFAMRISNKYDKGIFNMASIGFEALEWSEDPALMLPGQMLPTVTKCILKEVSITDIGANHNCCKLSHQGKTIRLNDKTSPEQLKDFFNSTITQPATTMKKVIMLLNDTKLVSLPEAAGEELVAPAVTVVLGELKQKDVLLSSANAEIARLKKEAADVKLIALKDKATQLVDSAIESKKILAADKDAYVSLASASEDAYTATKKILDGKNGYEPVASRVKPVGGVKLKAQLVKEFDEMSKDGRLQELKELAESGDATATEQLNDLWQAKFGKNAPLNKA